MNIQEFDLLYLLFKEPYINQRILSETTGYSLGKVNKSLKELKDQGFLNEEFTITKKTLREFEVKKPNNAIILAAGFGMRMIPINKEVTKGLLNVHGETLIERIIKHLHEIGIHDIDVVVGFMKERYEYLIDKYGVNLVCNDDYALKNNIHSLNLVADRISNTYIIPCDIYCENNPFSSHELYSWYMVSDIVDDESTIRINRKLELVTVDKDKGGNAMIGIAYILDKEAKVLKKNLKKLCADKKYNDVFWEEALMHGDKMIVNARLVPSITTYEIDTFEQLRELDENASELKSEIISLIAEIFDTNTNAIKNISVLKKGMTNRSFKFECKGKHYIMRIPGEGTDKMIDRNQEYAVYQVLKGRNLSDHVIYINPDNGYKITEFWEEAKVCDPSIFDQVKLCINQLRELHELKIKVGHSFDIFDQMEHFESLRAGSDSIYRDYIKTKDKAYELKEYIDSMPKDLVLSHIDSVPDNFLFLGDTVKMIDWEYAGMHDPHVDIAMFAIYSLYDREGVDQLIGMYFPEGCEHAVRIKIYCYVAVCGLLWSNWCEYKRLCGVEFGEYALRQYRYAKDFYKIAKEEMNKGVEI